MKLIGPKPTAQTVEILQNIVRQHNDVSVITCIFCSLKHSPRPICSDIYVKDTFLT